MSRCHVCGSPHIQELVGSTSIVGVSSDCVPMGEGQRLAGCRQCGTVVTMLSDSWREMCREIYVGYEAYRQAAGSEDLVFTGSGESSGRSKRIIDLCVSELGDVTRPWLDFGCGNGTFLRSVSAQFPTQRLVGMEFDDHVRDEVISIPGVLDLITSWDSHLAEDLGVISMIHVLEHIENPLALLRTARERLAPGGALLVEVPNVWTNPYALTVSDHATHFGVSSLSRLVASAGFDIAWAGADEIPGEITLVARRPTTGTRSPGVLAGATLDEGDGGTPVFDARLPQLLVDGLVATSSWLDHQRKANETLGILGTSIAGTWAAASLDLRHDLWVDEDPSRAGRAWLGKIVYTPSEVPTGTQVLAVLAPTKARSAADRLAQRFRGFAVAIPPAFDDSLGMSDWIEG